MRSPQTPNYFGDPAHASSYTDIPGLGRGWRQGRKDGGKSEGDEEKIGQLCPKMFHNQIPIRSVASLPLSLSYSHTSPIPSWGDTSG